MAPNKDQKKETAGSLPVTNIIKLLFKCRIKQGDRFLPPAVDNTGIYLGGPYFRMPQKSACRIEVGSHRKGHCGECMAAYVEGDMLLYSGLAGPCVQYAHIPCQSRKYTVVVTGFARGGNHLSACLLSGRNSGCRVLNRVSSR